MTTTIDRELLRRLPKAELHCHLDGSLRPATMLELAREQGVELPRTDERALAEYMLVSDARSLDDYLARFETTLSVMQTAPALERIAFELAEDAHRDGVRYIEVRYAPLLNVRRGLSLGEAVESPLRGLARARERFGIVGAVIVCGLRTLPPESSLEMARLAAEYRSRGVVGFDLAGAEEGNPASRHAAAFAYARQQGLGITCHGGEGAGPESIRDAVLNCCVDRIGHGTSLIRDEELTAYINDRRIAIEICLTSNVQTRAVSSYEDHPLRRYFDRGLNVSLHTDNRLMSGVSLSHEFEYAATRLGFTLDELARLALNGFESAFLPWSERRVLIAAARTDLAALGARIS